MPETNNPLMIDLNILPEPYRPKVAPPIVRILWLVAVLFLLFSLPLLILAARDRATLGRLESALAEVESTLRIVRTPPKEVILLREELSRSMGLVQQVETLYPILESERRDWPPVFSALADYDPQRIRLMEITQANNDLTVIGLARSRDDALSYASRLERSGVFHQVSIQSMGVVTIPFETPTPLPTATPTGTLVLTPTPLATLVPTLLPPQYDAYEPDDLEPGEIGIGESQTHNFFPQWDVDTARFLGKAGRRYCVIALPLVGGVDPVLEVKIGSQTWENDDCAYSTASHMACLCPTGGAADPLAAKVEVQIPGADQDVVIRVRNRGRYGESQTYALQVLEVVGDAWEVDDAVAKPIGVGETQDRSFFPVGDVDRVTFMAKANVAYSLSTANLAPGVDTVITVRVGDRTYRNDDRAPGEVASEVQFMTPVDQRVYANVTNKGLYGANATYQLVLGLVAGDEYEPDDNNPKPISPLEEQVRSFYPEGDVDYITFNTKGGVTYVIKTFDLAEGVDTVLSVEFDGQIFQNDDISQGNLASEVRFTAWKDGQALITVRNREQYGVERTYKIIVFPEVGPTATPTPDLRDPYEPDESAPPLLMVNEVQRRNFYPEGDVDYVRIRYKGGSIYQLRTENLAPGVDTVLEVVIEGVAYYNDDVSMGDVSSLIEFTPTHDGEAVAVIRNGGRFGAGQTYDLTLRQIVPPTPTPTLTPTADLRDAYEPDESSPPPLAVDQVQTRNFFPAGDIDYAQLTLEAGWVYFVTATGLVSDVQPYLSAMVDGLLYEAYPSGSSATLKLEPLVNQTAILEVRNFAGVYGSDKQYRLTLSRSVPTPTPTLSGSWLGPREGVARTGDFASGVKFPAFGHPLMQAEDGNPIRFVLLLRMK